MGGPTAQDLDVTPQQYETLEKFREQVAALVPPKLNDDYFLVRWLKARDFDLKKAEEMLTAHLEWRKEWKVDSILQDFDPPEVLRKYYPGGPAGFDKTGSPVWVVESAKLDMKGVSLSVKRDDFMRYLIWLNETILKMMEEQSEKRGKKVSQAVFLNDMDGFGMSHILQQGMDQMPRMMQMVEANYPEVMKTAMIVNAPRVFPVMYGIMKPFMSEATKRKIRLFGRDYRDTVKEMVDADTFPQYWGGNKVDADGDPRCPQLIPLGGKIPESYYLRGEDIVGEAEVTTITVGRASHHDVSFTVDDKKKVLKWAFWSIHYDIKYGVFYREKEGDKKVPLVAMERINAHQVPVDGWVKCDKPGTYFVRFDNVYSWVHSKQIHYVIELLDTSLEMDATDEQALQPMEQINAQSPPEPDAAYTPLFNLDDVKFIDEDSDDDDDDNDEEEKGELVEAGGESGQNGKASETKAKQQQDRSPPDANMNTSSTVSNPGSAEGTPLKTTEEETKKDKVVEA